MPNFNDQDSAPNGKSVYPFNVLGKIAAKPFYIWVNDDCSNKSDSFTEAKAVRLELFNDGGATAYIVDADGVEVVDTEIEAHEVLAKHDYFAGARKPEIRPDCSGAFMVNDPQDPDGYAIVGDDIAALIMEARDHLLTKSPVRDVPISTDKSSCIADAKSSHVDGEVIGIDGDGCLIQWDGQAGVAYNSGHDAQGFGMDNLSQLEKERLNLSVSGLASFDYQLLARLQQDCDYYLGHGNRSKKHLWAGGEAEQIAKMKELYSGLKEKPEWISLDDIDTYEARMLNFVTHPSSGKTGTFAARFDQHADRNGQTFTLIGTLDSGAYDKAECGEMFVVRFADGVEIHAWPEEVQSAINAVDGKAQLAFDQKLQGKVSKCLEHSSLPAIQSNVTVRLLEGVVVSGVVTGHGWKDGKPTFDFDYKHQLRDGQVTRATKWAWPEQVQPQGHGNVEDSIDHGLADAALKIVEDVCHDFDSNGISSVGAGAALRAMANHWKNHLHEGHKPRIISEDIDEMKNQLEVMRAEVMRRVAELATSQNSAKADYPRPSM